MGKKQIVKRPIKAQNVSADEAESVEVQVEAMANRMLTGVCIAGGIGVAILLFIFFSSDIPGKITAAAASKPAPVMQVSPVTAVPAENPDITDVLDDSDISKETVIAAMIRMSDAEFKGFVEKVTGDKQSSETGKASKEKSGKAESDPSSDVLIALVESGAGKGDIITYLQELNEKDFQAVTAALTAASEPGEDKSLRTSLEDAYAEAERLYPGQIDGSKRLKLIDELNATKFMYYVAEEGDTLIKLSRAFNVGLGQLVELNGIHDADIIPAGMILLFPSDTAKVVPK